MSTEPRIPLAAVQRALEPAAPRTRTLQDWFAPHAHARTREGYPLSTVLRVLAAHDLAPDPAALERAARVRPQPRRGFARTGPATPPAPDALTLRRALEDALAARDAAHLAALDRLAEASAAQTAALVAAHREALAARDAELARLRADLEAARRAAQVRPHRRWWHLLTGGHRGERGGD